MSLPTDAIRRTAIFWIIGALIASWLYLFLPKASAATGVVTTAGAGGNTAGWTTSNNANGSTDNNTYATAAPNKNQTTTGDWNTYGFDSSLPADVTITKVEIIVQYKVSTVLSLATLNVQAVVGGSACPGAAQTDTAEPIIDTDFTADITSCRTWSRANLLNASFSTRIGGARGNSNTAVTFSLDHVFVRVTYNTPEYEQSGYRWYDYADSTTPGSPLANSNTAATLFSPNDKFRLRYLLHLSNVNLSSGGEQFKLQFGQKSGSCAASTYADVTTGSTIAYYNTPTPANDTTISTHANDPTHSGHTIIAQKYAENSPFNTVNAIATGQDGIWDVSLYANGASANTTYCFRVVKNSGTALDIYTAYPEIITAPSATLSTDYVDSNGSSVTSPSVALTNAIFSLDCQTTTSTLGTNSQRIRVKNTTVTPGWSLSIAATAGSTALWSAGTPKYDFNDGSGSPAGCSAGLDSDAYAGQMTINPSSGTLAARAAALCNTTGITKGSQASFSEGVTNSITLMSASATAATGCYWELTNTAISQKIPSEQSLGSYTINLTMTVVAN